MTARTLALAHASEPVEVQLAETGIPFRLLETVAARVERRGLSTQRLVLDKYGNERGTYCGKAFSTRPALSWILKEAPSAESTVVREGREVVQCPLSF